VLGHSRLRHPDHVDRLLVVLALAYAWMLALGSQAVAANLPRAFSLFKEGLAFFVEVLQRYSAYLGLLFTPDKRFT